MKRALPTGVRFLFLAAILWIHLTELWRAGELAQIAGLAVAGAVFFAALCSDAAAVFALASAALLAPFFGSQGLNLAVVTFMLGALFRGSLSHTAAPGKPLFGELLGWLSFGALLALGTTLRREHDRLLLHSLLESGGPVGVVHYLLRNPARWNLPVLNFLGVLEMWLLYCSLESIFRRSGEARCWCVRGLSFAAAVSGMVLLAQLLHVHPWSELNLSAFWRLTGRLPATFSDPNAFGVMAGLLALYFGLFVSGRNGWCTAVAIAIAGLWSGSRTYLILLAAGFGFAACFAPRWSRFSRLFGVALPVLGLAVVIPPLNEFLQRCFPVATVVRVLQTLHWEHARSMFESRVVFSRVAFAVWDGSPVAGVGLGRFLAEEVTAAERLGVPLGEWRDNANNYYLSVLAEGGAAGLTMVGFAWWSAGCALRRTATFHSAGIATLGAFALALVTGPHLLFDEVRVFLALLLATIGAYQTPSSRRTSSSNIAAAAAAVLLTIAVFLHPFEKPAQPDWSGFYGKEYGNEGDFVWSGKEARVRLCPRDRRTVVLRFRAAHPDIAAHPVTLRGSADLGQGVLADQTLLFMDDSWHQLEFAVEPGQELTVRLTVDHVWSPAGGEWSGDARWLGVMMSIPEDRCSVPS